MSKDYEYFDIWDHALNFQNYLDFYIKMVYNNIKSKFTESQFGI